ncbi:MULTISPECIES: glutamate synthase large subunit [Bacillus]|uniref:Glutamate synthase n=2 Tax=Bacillus TaxID=1386 RepID=A0A0M4FQ90_9BACI|nr:MULTISPECIES: glutamate synthase large subunit [Bacillus]ALC81284.1 glutamate synthase [Bacillus gobiensis]MBP1080293.1 glutamate synthase (NADPH/NADH) large chain [Bacillus capparidis]MED1094156.1 glutamate synthase large subunit [Bacillus capparidis]
MSFNQMPNAQGLYRPEFEHDACGIGLYAHLKGHATHDVVKKGLKMLCQLDHRGGQGSDPETGDGAGLMVQIPDSFFRKVCTSFQLPEQGRYGVGMAFFSTNEQERKKIEEQINTLIRNEGQQLLGWRTVPVNPDKIGKTAHGSLPFIRQVFIGANDQITNDLDFERKLYIIRKQAENWAAKEELPFYIPSLSSKTIVFKGLLTPEQVDEFYLDLKDSSFLSNFALVHSRFSTNTFPSWERAHPNRYLIHNGEINTLRGNINWMKAREKQFVSDAFGDDLEKILPILDENGSDSSVLDNAFEFFVLAGRKPAHAAMMLIPEPWTENPYMSKEKRAFYEFHSTMMEPWDGPTAISFTDGKQIGAILDRNGLRPARYYVTNDDYIIFSSEVGVIDVEEEDVRYKDRLEPGKMLLIDLEEGRIISDEEVKSEIAGEMPYQEWMNQELVHIAHDQEESGEDISSDLLARQKAFGYTYEDVKKYLLPVINEGKDPLGSMGNDAPLAVLSDRPQSLFNYFKQLFAQVTNPPIDAIREQIVTSTITWIGAEGDILHPTPECSRRIKLYTPLLTNGQLNGLKTNVHPDFKSKKIHTLFKTDVKDGLKQMFKEAETAIAGGVSLLILSDRAMDSENAPIPTLLAVSALHQHLIRKGIRTKASIIVESGEAREVHHFAALIGYGADAINPYLTFATYKDEIKKGNLDMTYEDAVIKYSKSITEGVVKVMSKMGISTVQSYRGAQIFEAVGISNAVIDEYFTGTHSQIGGIDLNTIGKETLLLHKEAYKPAVDQTLDPGSDFQWRKHGEHHAFNPKTIHTLQWACRKGDYSLFKEYSNAADEERLGFLRNLFAFNEDRKSLPIEEVESADSIVKRFKTGAMSFGSLSQEAHETLAIAMNRIGGKSNSGEGGEDPNRFTPDANGDNRRSAIKQIASGRFGVKSHYLVNADELQIKMAQGAKPGEGGQLPGNKVYPWVAGVRGSTPGVGLISPPPHHDIYSIEDLAQLIHDLKNSNRDARISVKLVAKSGVGTIAAGVAKGAADVIVISGYDGGTGASPKTSIKHTGLPWELGLAEAHQTLMLNNLRNKVVLETDGKLMTGRDVVMAALFGAEEFGFATAPLVVLGCIMMRACHLDTCPVGVATQNPELRKKFTGNADHIVNFMYFIAEEVREIMAELGFKTLDEMVGRTDVLRVSSRAKSHWKAGQLDLSTLLYQVSEGDRTFNTPQNHKLDKSLDLQEILPAVLSAIEKKERVNHSFEIHNTNRVVGTIVGSEISKRYGEEGLPENTINLTFNGSAGQSFGAFVPKGMSLQLIGDANDYLGKGLSGGKISVRTPDNFSSPNSDNVIIGNVAFYGATSGEAYINGRAGERFAVRNSGVKVVVEGIGEHGCEYMTGGRVVVLGEVGRNFAAGMSGGIAYVYAGDQKEFKRKCNQEMVDFEKLIDENEIHELKEMIVNHFNHTDSKRAAQILENWEEEIQNFVKVIPNDYKKMVEKINEQKAAGFSDEEAMMFAFESSTRGENAPASAKHKEAVTH